MQQQDQRPGRRAWRARPSAGLARLAGFAVLPAALVVTGLFISTSSYAVFNKRTSNTGNSFASGTVMLQHDASGSYSATSTTAFVNISGSSGLQPGVEQRGCINIRSTGTLPSGEVRLYATTPSTGIATRISVTLVQGTAASTCGSFAADRTLYSGTLDNLATATDHMDYATGYATGWTPTVGANEVRAYRVTATLDAGVSSSVQGTSASAKFVWETQGT